MMKRIDPIMIVGAVFAGLGALFTGLGVTFTVLGWADMPRLFSGEIAAAGGVPDELAFPFIGLTFAAMGLVFLLCGVGMLRSLRKQRLMREELLRFGTRVTGTVAEIYIDRSVRVNGRSPLRIMVQVQHPFTGMTQVVRGPRVWQTSLSVGDPAEVLFDPQDEKKHVVLLPGEENA